MKVSTFVSVPDLDLATLKTRFVVARPQFAGDDMDDPALSEVYSAPGAWRDSGAFTGVLWNHWTGHVQGYNEDFGETDCAGWHEFVAFVRELAAAGKLPQGAELGHRTDEDLEMNYFRI